VSDLSAQLAAARADVAARPDGQLIRGRRHAILRALGDGDDGRAIRARLARGAVLHVLPIWHAARPGDGDPERVLDMIDAALDGSVDETEVRRAAGELWGRVDNLTVTTGPESPLHVGYAAAKALLAATFDEPLDSGDAEPDRTDAGCDPQQLDTAFIASTAAADGTPWMPESDPARRREFWEWWLNRVAAVGGSTTAS
jgi:Immunity protein Imm5